MLLITSQKRPAICSRCHQEIAVLIAAATPRNPRRHIVQVATAFYRATDGAVICPGCWEEELAERALILSVASGECEAEQPEPVYWRPQPERRNGGKPQPAPAIVARNRRRNGPAGEEREAA